MRRALAGLTIAVSLTGVAIAGLATIAPTPSVPSRDHLTDALQWDRDFDALAATLRSAASNSDLAATLYARSREQLEGQVGSLRSRVATLPPGREQARSLLTDGLDLLTDAIRRDLRGASAQASGPMLDKVNRAEAEWRKGLDLLR